jgi:hypothetical protein
LILLVFLFPLAIYLLVLGVINRRRHPLVVSGVWDFIGVLFAASGFLLFGGPAILTGLYESWRMHWLLGPTPSSGSQESFGAAVWVWALYFVFVVGGAALVFRRRRHLTAVYNVEPLAIEKALNEACDRHGLNPVRSGNLFLFGFGVGRTAEGRATFKDGIQAPHYLPAASEPEHASTQGSLPALDDLLGQAAILEVDCFPAMNHVTLRWDPADSPLRQEIEIDLARRLGDKLGPDSELGGWLLLVGSTLLFGTFMGGTLLIVVRLFRLY